VTRALTQMREEVIRQLKYELEADIASRGEVAVGWRAHFELAAFRFALEEDDAQVRSAFASASRVGVSVYLRSPNPTLHRTPFYFGQLAGIVAAFGQPEEREQLATIPRHHFLSPEVPEYAEMADSYATLQSYLGGRPDLACAQRVLATPTRRKRDVASYSRPLAESIVRLTERNAAAIAAQVATMATLHAHLACDGDLQFNEAGFIAVLPLGIVQLAREQQLECSIHSPHVPLELLRKE
jgi:hypothetical protein